MFICERCAALSTLQYVVLTICQDEHLTQEQWCGQCTDKLHTHPVACLAHTTINWKTCTNTIAEWAWLTPTDWAAPRRWITSW